MATREEVIMAYKLLLGRDPENEDIITYHCKAHVDRFSLISTFTVTDEYKKQLNIEYFPKQYIPSIFLVTLQKSGSKFLHDTLLKGLNLNKFYRYFTKIEGKNQYFSDFAKGNKIIFEHTLPNFGNIMFFCTHLDKIVLHIRDPRSAIVSMAHFIDSAMSIDALSTIQWSPTLYYISTCEWYNISKEEKFDVIIKLFYKSLLEFLNSWFDLLQINFSGRYVNSSSVNKEFHKHNIFTLNIATAFEKLYFKEYGANIRVPHENPFKTDVLLTVFEDLLESGEESFFKQIISFYNIDEHLFTPPKIKKDASVHFRTGKKASWTLELNEQQQEYVTTLLPLEWRTYFGWE